MITFIIIGRNEGWRLIRSIQSIKKLIEYNNLSQFEIIYIDSNSSDDSIKNAISEGVNKIFEIKGDFNSAIARNIGANTAKGDFLFFVDGDIELIPFDLDSIFKNSSRLIDDYVVGFLDDVNYTSNWSFIERTPRHYKNKIIDKKVTTVGGGILIVNKILWHKYNGMDNRLKRSQDRDFSLRLAKDGIHGIRKSEVFGLHHTVPYKDKKRMWERLFDGSLLFKGVIIRRHIFNKRFWPILMKEEYTLMMLFITIISISMSPLLLVVYTVALAVKTRKYILSNRSQVFIHRLLQDISVLFAVFFFYPPKPEFTEHKIK